MKGKHGVRRSIYIQVVHTVGRDIISKYQSSILLQYSLLSDLTLQHICRRSQAQYWVGHHRKDRTMCMVSSQFITPNLNAKMCLLTSIFTSFHSMSQKEKEESASPVQFSSIHHQPGLTTRGEHQRLLIKAKRIAAQ